MSIIGELAVNVAARVGDLRRGLGSGRRELSGFMRFAGRAGVAVSGMAVSAAIALDRFAEAEGRTIDAIAKTSDKLGIQTQDLIGLQYAAEVTAGVVDNTFNMAMQRMRRRIAEAAQGTGEAKGALLELGLSAEHLNSLTTDQQLYAVADAMQRVTDQGDRVRLAFKLFDSEGVDLVNTLKNGRAELERLTQEGADLAGVTREQAAAVEALNDRQTKASEQWTGMRRDVALAASPVRDFSITLKEEFARSMSAALENAGLVTRAVRDQVDILEQAAEAARQRTAAERELREERGRAAAQQRAVAIRRQNELIEQTHGPYWQRMQSVRDSIATVGVSNPLERELALLRNEPDVGFTRGVRNELAKELERLIKLEAEHEEKIRRQTEAMQRREQIEQMSIRRQNRAADIKATELSRLEERLQEIRSLHGTGELSTAEALAASQRLADGIGSGRSNRTDNALLQINSAEAFRAIRSTPQGDPIQKRQLEEQTKMRQAAENQVTLFEQLLDVKLF